MITSNISAYCTGAALGWAVVLHTPTAHAQNFENPARSIIAESPSSTTPGLVAAGGIMVTGGFVGALGYGASIQFEKGASWLLLPVVGPWAALVARPQPCGPLKLPQTLSQESANQGLRDLQACVDTIGNHVTFVVVTAADGIVQGTGLLLLIAGLVSGSKSEPTHNAGAWRLAPRRFVTGGLGVELSGRF